MQERSEVRGGDAVITEAEVGGIIKEVSMRQGIWETSRSWKRQGNGPPLEPAEGTNPADPDLGPRRLFMDFHPPGLSRRMSVLFSAMSLW